MNAYEAGVVDGMTKAAKKSINVSLVKTKGMPKTKAPKQPKAPNSDPQQMGMGAFTMRRGGEIKKTVPNQQPPKPQRY
jgi:hypothetical protein